MNLICQRYYYHLFYADSNFTISQPYNLFSIYQIFRSTLETKCTILAVPHRHTRLNLPIKWELETPTLALVSSLITCHKRCCVVVALTVVWLVKWLQSKIIAPNFGTRFNWDSHHSHTRITYITYISTRSDCFNYFRSIKSMQLPSARVEKLRRVAPKRGSVESSASIVDDTAIRRPQGWPVIGRRAMRAYRSATARR